MKFRVKKVNRFVHEGRTYRPGDIINLPESMLGMDFLEPVEPEKPKVTLPEPSIAPVEEAKIQPSKAEPRKKSKSSAASPT